MKKHSKLLVLVLSLALIIGAIAVVASADNGVAAKIGATEYATLAGALEAVKEGEEIVLVNDATLDTYTAKVSFTLNLNGKTLTTTNADAAAITVEGAINVSIKGAGKIVAAGTLVNQAAAAAAPVVTVEGSNLVIEHNPKTGKALFVAAGGEYVLKNLDVTSGLFAGVNEVFSTTADSVAKYKLTNVVIKADSEDNVDDRVFYVQAGSSVELTDSYVHTSGGFSRFKASTAAAPFKILNSVIEQKYTSAIEPGNARKTCFLLGWGDELKGGAFVVENSFMEICYRLNCGGGASTVKFVNSTLRHSGYTETETSTDIQLLRYANVEFDANSKYVVARNEGAITHNADGSGGKLFVGEGFRTNAEFLTTRTGYSTFVMPDGKTADASEQYKFVFDPAGDMNVPYVVVDVTKENAVTNPVGADTIRFFDNTELYSSDPDGYIAKDDGVTANNFSVRTNCKMFNINGPTGTGFAWNVGAYAGCGTSMVGVVGDNSFYKYWVNPLDETSTVRKVVGITDAGKVPCFLPGSNTGENLADSKVIVYDVDFATDSDKGFVGFNVELQSGARTCYMTLQADGTVTTTSSLTKNPEYTLDKLSFDSWHRITVVLYTETKTVYLYIDGQYLGKGTEKDSVTSVNGLRLNSGGDQNVNATLLLDNAMERLYTNYRNNDTAENQTPEYYLSNLPMNKELDESYGVMGTPYFDANEAITAAAALEGRYAYLTKDVLVPVVIKSNGYLDANGHKLILGEGSYGADIQYDADGNPTLYEFNSTYNDLKVRYGWYKGEGETWDDASYVFTEVGVGQTPIVPEELNIPGITTKNEEDGYYYLSSVIGWSEGIDATTPDDFAPVTIADAKKFALTQQAYYTYPVFGAPTKQNYRYVIIDTATGAFKRGGNLNFVWGSKVKSDIALAVGETFVLCCDDMRWAGGFDQTTFGKGEIGIDLNGHTMFIDGSENDTRKITTFFNVKADQTLNVYSSRAGGRIYSIGLNDNEISHKKYWNESNPASNGGFLGIPETAYTKGASGGALFTMIPANRDHVSNNGETNYNAHITIGTYNGKYAGNLTIEGAAIVAADSGDKTCSVTVDGVTIIRNSIDYAASVFTRFFYGTVKVTNSTFYSGVGGGFFGAHGQAATIVTDETTGVQTLTESPTGTYTVDGCVVIVNKDGANVFADTQAMGNVTVTNTITNGTIGYTSTLKQNVTIGEGVAAYAIKASAYAEGIVAAAYNLPMQFAQETVNVPYIYAPKTEKGTLAYKKDIEFRNFVVAANGYTGEADLVLGVLGQMTVKAEDVVKVTFKGLNGGEDIVVDYVKGGKIVAPAYQAIDNGIFKFVHDGTFVEELPEVVTEAITLTPNVKSTVTLKGVKTNLSVYSDFLINLYIPAAYAENVVSIIANKTVLATTKVTIDEVEYIKVVVAKDAEDAAVNTVFTINLRDGDIVGTATVTVSVASYAETVLAGETYTAADKQLMYYVLNYANEAAKYFDGAEDATLKALLETYAAAKGEGMAEQTYANAIETLALGEVFESATVELTAAPAFVLNVKDNFVGTVTITYGDQTRTFEITADSDRAIVLKGMKAYNFGLELTVNAEGTIGETAVKTENAKYNLDTFVKYHVNSEAEESVACEALLVALYDYVACATAYKAV